jgi:hypothetical protein
LASTVGLGKTETILSNISQMPVGPENILIRLGDASVKANMRLTPNRPSVGWSASVRVIRYGRSDLGGPWRMRISENLLQLLISAKIWDPTAEFCSDIKPVRLHVDKRMPGILIKHPRTWCER